MKSLRHIGLLAAAAGAALVAGPAAAQRQPPSPDQRLERLEREMNQVQRQVFPRGRPADTAGFAHSSIRPREFISAPSVNAS